MQKFKQIWHGVALFSVWMIIEGCVRPSSQAHSEVAASQVISRDVINLDLTSSGPYQVKRTLYGRPILNGKPVDLDARIDPLVLPGRVTDLRGALWMPQPGARDERFPLLVFLHGNHNTCRKIKQDARGPSEESPLLAGGTCREFYEEIPSYLGYEYLAQKMASHGYIVVSINANRGITGWDMEFGPDSLLIEARGRLVLKHLAWLRLWDSGARDSKADLGLDIKGRISFDHVGLMGHSRGGEAMRAAISQILTQDPQSYGKDLGNIKIGGILEFAPVDLYASKPYDAPQANWTVVIGSCDGDVKDYEGTGTFRRRRVRDTSGVFSSVFIIPGANHNFFNTEWTSSDAESCDPSVKPLFSPLASQSAEQQQAAIMTLSAFFRGFVTPNRELLEYRKVFDPQYQIPNQMSQLVSPTRESFHQKEGEKVSLLPNLTTTQGVKIDYITEKFGQTSLGREDLTVAQRKFLYLTWKNASSTTMMESTTWETPRDLGGKWILSLAMGRYQKCFLKDKTKTCNKPEGPPLDMAVSLIMGNGHISKPVRLADYAAFSESLNEYLIIDECPLRFTLDTTLRRCISREISNKYLCTYVSGSWDSSGVCTLNLKEGFQRPLVFQEVPIELADFQEPNLGAVKGFRFVFDRTSDSHLLLDQTVILRSKSIGESE